MSDEPPITIAEAHAAGSCARGNRAWLNANVPGWREMMVAGGFPVELVREWNAALADRVLKLREDRRGKET